MERVECGCGVCQSYCERIPGWFKPGELEKAAELKHMTPAEFFKEFVTVDYCVGDTVFALRPRTVAEVGGEVSSFNPYRNRCVFFTDDGKCEIHTAKPYECATSGCQVDLPSDWHKQTANSWCGSTQVAELLGYEPKVPKATLSDALGLFFM